MDGVIGFIKRINHTQPAKEVTLKNYKGFSGEQKRCLTDEQLQHDQITQAHR